MIPCWGVRSPPLIKAGEWAQGALSQVMLRHIRHFERLDHSYLRERAVDVRDLGTRVLSYLQDASRQEVDYPAATILVAEELTAATLGRDSQGPARRHCIDARQCQ